MICVFQLKFSILSHKIKPGFRVEKTFLKNILRYSNAFILPLPRITFWRQNRKQSRETLKSVNKNFLGADDHKDCWQLFTSRWQFSLVRQIRGLILPTFFIFYHVENIFFWIVKNFFTENFFFVFSSLLLHSSNLLLPLPSLPILHSRLSLYTTFQSLIPSSLLSSSSFVCRSSLWANYESLKKN